jgi:hypothetical protein
MNWDKVALKRRTLELLHEARWDAVVAIEGYIFEKGGDAVPARSCGGFEALYAGGGGNDDIAAAHRAADKNDFDFNLRSSRQLLWAEEEDAAGADVSGNQGDRILFLDVVDAAKAERQAQGGAGIFPVFRVNADGMRRNPDELAGLGVA